MGQMVLGDLIYVQMCLQPAETFFKMTLTASIILRVSQLAGLPVVTLITMRDDMTGVMQSTVDALPHYTSKYHLSVPQMNSKTIQAIEKV